MSEVALKDQLNSFEIFIEPAVSYFISLFNASLRLPTDRLYLSGFYMSVLTTKN